MDTNIKIQNENTISNEGIIQKSHPSHPSQSIYANVKERLIDIIENLISTDKNEEQKDINNLLNEKFLNLDFASQYDIDMEKVGLIDASFFLNLFDSNEAINYNIKDNKITFTQGSKNIEISSSLMNVLNSSLEAKKPIRLDFDKDITVILKMDKDGKIQTHFIPGSLEVESYLKQNLVCLKQRFDDEQINYSHMGYSKYKEDENKKENKNKKGQRQ